MIQGGDPAGTGAGGPGYERGGDGSPCPSIAAACWRWPARGRPRGLAVLHHGAGNRRPQRSLHRLRVMQAARPRDENRHGRGRQAGPPPARRRDRADHDRARRVALALGRNGRSERAVAGLRVDAQAVREGRAARGRHSANSTTRPPGNPLGRLGRLHRWARARPASTLTGSRAAAAARIPRTQAETAPSLGPGLAARPGVGLVGRVGLAVGRRLQLLLARVQLGDAHGRGAGGDQRRDR